MYIGPLCPISLEEKSLLKTNKNKQTGKTTAIAKGNDNANNT